MIYGKLDNVEELGSFYLSEPWKISFDLLKTLTAESPLGITRIHGDEHFVNVHTYSTKKVNQCRFERHKHTIDIQYIIKGSEFVDLVDIHESRDVGEWDFEKDFQFAGIDEVVPFSRNHLKEGFFAVYFPEDVHRPQIDDGLSRYVLKAVIKIDLSQL